MGEQDKWLQIMPSDGWYSVALTDEEPYYDLWRLVGWVLLETPRGDREVVGLDAADYIDVVEGLKRPHYVYVHQDDITDECRAGWAKRGRERFERRKRQAPPDRKGHDRS